MTNIINHLHSLESCFEKSIAVLSFEHFTFPFQEKEQILLTEHGPFLPLRKTKQAMGGYGSH